MKVLANPIAVQNVSNKLGISPDEIHNALTIAQEYDRERQRLRQDHKEKARRLQYQQQLQKEKIAHPDWCFCREDGFEVERKYEGDGIIKYRTAYSFYDFEKQHPYQEPVFRCSRCGLGYIMQVAIA